MKIENLGARCANAAPGVHSFHDDTSALSLARVEVSACVKTKRERGVGEGNRSLNSQFTIHCDHENPNPLSLSN